VKKKILLGILVFVALFTITGCGKSNDNENNSANSSKVSDVFKIKEVSLKFDQDKEFYNFKYKNINGINPDESKQAVYLDYKNAEIYNGRFVFRISLSFIENTNIKDYLNGKKTTTKKINEINWETLTLNNTVDNKNTTSKVFVTEKGGTIYTVSVMSFNEANIDLKELSEVFINGVTLK